MAGSKVLGLAVLLAAAALLAATATAVDDEHMYHWKCFTSCNTRCHDEDNAAAAAKVDGAGSGLNASVSVLGGAGHRCKKGCLNECFENFPALCYQQCVVSTCLCKPPYSKEKMECMKMCCDKCFHHGPAPPMPPKPAPPKPSPPKPTPPKPSPPNPSPPQPYPPKPTPPKPSPSPPVPKPPSPPVPSPPKPPRPPCPPGEEKVMGSIKN